MMNVEKCCEAPLMVVSGVRELDGKDCQVDMCVNCGKQEVYSPELGQAVFGYSADVYDFYHMPDSYIVEYLLRVLSHYATGDSCYSSQFDNDTFSLNPYYWGDDPDEAERPNFLHKPSGLEIRWYKYIGRGMGVNGHVCPDCFYPIFIDCMNSLAEEGN